MADLSTKELEELRQLYKDLQNISIPNMDSFVKAMGGMEAARKNLQQMRQEFANINSDINYLSASLSKVLNELKGQNGALNLTKKSYSTLSSIANQLKYDQDGITKLSKKELENQGKRIGQERQRLELAKEINKTGIIDLRNQLINSSFNPKKIAQLQAEKKALEEANKEIDGFLKDQENGINSLVNSNSKRLAQEIEIEKTLGLTGAAIDGIIGSLGKLGISNTFFEGLKDNMREAAKSSNSFKVMLTAAGGLAKGIGQAITDPLTVMTFLISQGLKANKQVTDLGKSLGISYKEANNLRQEFVAYSRAANDAFVTTDRLIKAQTELSEQLGISVKFSEKELVTFSKLTEIVGLSAQEAGKLALNSAAAGAETTDYVKQIRLASFAAQQTNKVHFSDKQILQDVSKISSGILVKFQNNPKALAAAVVQAKALGLTLEQVDKVGESLLNFESSIENELKAELLTGRQLNVERARYAALTGDQLTLTKEIAEQAGSLAEFEEMNVLAQRSLAEAFGMSRDELADMLLKQEAINKYGSEASKLNAQQLKDFEKSGLSLDNFLQKQSEQLSAQENFNNAVLKLQDLLAGIVSGPIGQLVGGFAELVNHALILKPLVGAIAGLVAGKMVMGIFNFGKGIVAAIPKLATMVGLSSAKAVAEITAAEAMSLGLATFGIVAGIASAVSAMNSATSEATANAQNVQDGISPASKGPFTITDAYGSTAVTTKGDGVVVSPNINTTPLNSTRQNSINLSPITEAIAMLSNTVSGLVNRPQPAPQFALNVDGRTLGTVVGKQMETGTSQIMNTGYQLA